MRRTRGRGAIAGSTATIMCLNILLALAVSLALPQRAHAAFVADDIAAVAGIAAAAAATYGLVTNTTWANQTGVTDRSTAALYSELSMTGAMGEVGMTSAATVGYLMAARAGMIAQGTWTNFCAAANAATAYGGYLWSHLTAGLYGNLAFQGAGGTVATYPSVAAVNVSMLTSAELSAARALPLATGRSGVEYAICNWAMSSLAGGHASPTGWTITAHVPGSYVTMVSNECHPSAVGMTVSFAVGNNKVLDNVDGDARCQLALNWAAGLAATYPAGAIDVPTVKTYTDNPDMLPLSPAITAANIGTVEANVGAGAIAIPTALDPVPWVPPVWLPKAPDITGIGNDLRGLASEVAALFGETWAWLAAPFTGLLTGIAAITDWLSGITGWLEATIASIFSPSGTQLSLEFQPRWSDLQSKLSGKWPWAIGPAIGLLAGSIMGGTASGGRELSTTWHVTLYKGISFDLSLGTLLDPVAGFRWFLVAWVWVTLGIGLFKLFRPEVIT